jgi:hypothetical protein
MPRIVVVSDVPGSDSQMFWSERVDASSLVSEHFRGQLAERLAWAVGDADRVEQAHRGDSDLDGLTEALRSVEREARDARYLGRAGQPAVNEF